MPSGLLHDEHVRYYLPLDDLAEYTQEIAWTGDAAQFIPSIFTSGVEAPSTSISLKHLLVPYDDMANASGFTCAVWTSGFLTDDTTFRYAQIGYSNSSDSIRNALWFYKATTATGFRIYVEVDNTSQYKDWTPSPTNDPGWHLILVDGRYETSGWRHRVSLDGSGWVDLGVDTNTGVPGSDDRVRINTAQGSDAVDFALDEVVLWAGNELFTDQELYNIYELGDTHGRTMNEYVSTFGTVASGSADIFVHGHADTSGSIGLYIPGQKETASIPLFLQAQTFVSGSVGLFIAANVPHSGDLNYYIHGHNPSSGSMNLYVSGVPFTTDSIDLYTWGHAVASGDSALFIRGRLQYIDAFVEVVANNPSDDLDLFVYGAAPGESDLFYTNGNITLFIKDAGEVSTTNGEWSSFVEVAGPATISYSGVWSSFVKVGNVSTGTANMYVQGHASGESPRGILTTGSASLFIEGKSVYGGDTGLLSDGYYALNAEVAAFAQVHLGISGGLNLFISGSAGATLYSGMSNLYMFGISGVSSGSIDVYTYGKDTVNDNVSLFTFGIEGIASGDHTLYIKVTDIGEFNQSSDLYTHGF